MNRLLGLFGTSIGRKLVTAVTGLALIGFLIGHMLGNMTMFQGADNLNAYASWLQGHPLIWLARFGLLAVFGIHLVTAISLALENRRARPVGYGRKELVAATLSSRYIVVSGLLLLTFVVFHLGHFTLGFFQPEHFHVTDAHGRHDVFRMVVSGFQNPFFSSIYIAAMLLLGFHLHHGVKSLAQTLGLNHDSYSTLLSLAGNGLVALIVLGNCSFPILVLLGVINAPGGN